MKIIRTYSRLAKEAASLLGKEIQLARKERVWSEQTLAERIGISRTTLQKMEAGDMTVAIGLVLEAAVILGIPLFASETPSLTQSIRSASDKLTLMPKRIRNKTKKVKDDF
ncbi:helix-turn-helix domain-containing protein [Leptospira vanthielii]|uniref:XRE family transcriptional regulator n=1 Tax=Leptospira vanthielii TaxID=293085 RepID=A0ABY2NK37_9LEPT|nr:helix-turn-helix transcriptional regulator [Leptospira vanthielii]TGM45974.1 XRE family transcriptional regulator [Leptospira vanthielii]